MRKPLIITSDAGGTMTDLFLIDPEGEFSVGKASTTPHDESIGYWESLEDAFSYWGIDLERQGREILPHAEIAIYTGTSMLNAILTRTGRRVGLLITKGLEDSFVLERGFQKVAGYSYADRFHTVTHLDNPPLIPKRHIRGVTERIDLFGTVAIPLYEHEVRRGVAELLEEGVEAIAILFLFSHVNPEHEQAAARIAREVMAEAGREVSLYLSSEISPIIRELARLNSVVLQAYAAEPVRAPLLKIEGKMQSHGFRYPLQTLLSYGGLANIRHRRLYESIVSGPVGGILGAKYIADTLGLRNLVTTDLGGTSFDIGVIREGMIPVVREPEFARFLLNLPMVVVNSVAAGTGLYLRIDPLTHRILLGPDGTGAYPGPVCYDQGNETPTLMDADLLLGIINPDYYLGGKLKLNPEKAHRLFQEKIADPLGLDLYEAAEGVVRLADLYMGGEIQALLLSRGYSPAEYHLISFGGAGPMHMAGYSQGMGLQGIFTLPFAAAFSAFGCASVDYTHRLHRSILAALPPGADDGAKEEVGALVNRSWEALEEEALMSMREEGFKEQEVSFTRIAFVRYGGQLDDVEVISPTPRIQGAREMDRLLALFEELYTKIYTSGARYPEGGYQILEVGLLASAPKIKPRLKPAPVGDGKPDGAALKGKRRVYWGGRWQEAPIYEMDLLKANNRIEGTAVIEAPTTTLFVPPGKQIRADEWGFLWLEG